MKLNTANSSTLLTADEIAFLLQANKSHLRSLPQIPDSFQHKLKRNLLEQLRSLFSQKLNIDVTQNENSPAENEVLLVLDKHFSNCRIQVFFNNNTANGIINACLGFCEPYFGKTTAPSKINEKIVTTFKKKFCRGIIRTFATASKNTLSKLPADISILLQINFCEIKIHLHTEKNDMQLPSSIKAAVRLSNIPIKLRQVLNWQKGTYIPLPDSCIAEIDSGKQTIAYADIGIKDNNVVIKLIKKAN